MDVRAVDGTDIPAAGSGTTTIRLRLTEAGAALPAGARVRADVIVGDARFAIGGATADLQTDADGTIALELAPGTKAGPLQVRVEADDAIGEVQLTLVATAPKPIVVGFATGGVGAVPGSIEAADDAPNGSRSRRGAIAFFGTGKIAKNTRGTFAYRSADTLAPSLATGPFLADPNDRPFPIYGDTSIRRADALSTDRFYGRIQNGRSSAMWGEFYARGGATGAVGGYDLLVDGASLDLRGPASGIRAFTSSNRTAYDRRTIAPTGLAIADQLLHPDIVVGSDVLALVHLDRRTGATISQTTLLRGTDYVLDYASGLLRFTNVILPYDDDFDPQIVVVSYQYGGPGARSTMVGADADAAIAPHASLSAWYLNDAHGEGNLALSGIALSGAHDGVAWSVSHERSAGYLPIGLAQYGSSGDAFRATASARGTGYRADLSYQETGAGYDDPYGAYSSPGMRELRAGLDIALGGKTDLELRALSAANHLPATAWTRAVDNADASASAILHVRPDARFAYHLGVRADAASSNGVLDPAFLLSPDDPQNTQNAFFPPAFTIVQYQAGDGHDVAADVGFDWKFAPHASLQASRIAPFGGGYDPYAPPETRAELDLDVAGGQAFVRQLWQDGPTQALAASQAAQTAAAGATSATSIGFSRRVGIATVESGYAVEHTAAGTDLYDAIGVRGTIAASKHLTADAFLQAGDELAASFGTGPGTTPHFVALGGSIAYGEAAFRSTAQYQMRTGFNAGSNLQVGAAGPISESTSLFGAYTGSFTQYVRDSEVRAGLSYRPARDDRYVTLLSVDSTVGNLTNYDAYATDVAQFQELWRPDARTELAASVAYKLTGDAFFAPHTSILGLRADRRLGSRFDLAAEGHWSAVAPLNGTNATGFALEAGQRIGSTLRLAAGFNFSGFADPASGVTPTHRGLYLTVSSYLDRIFGWGKDDTK